MENIREIVLDTLLALEKKEVLSHLLIRDVLNKYDYLSPQEKAFIKRVTEGTIERQMELDYDLDAYSSVPVKKMKPLIRCLMRMSVYQLLYMDGVPDSAVCNEACKLAAKRKFQSLKGFVNGVLRKIAREKEKMPLPDRQTDGVHYLCIRYSMPELITKVWVEAYGYEMTEKILQGLLEVHPVSVRIREDLSKEEENGLIRELERSGAVVRKSPYAEKLYLAEGIDGIGNLEAFRSGKMTVQDASSVLAVKAAGIKEGDFVIDACAAPGGKSILAAELAGESGRVLAGDVSENKADRIRENADRMGTGQLTVRVWDARRTDPELIEKADVLILDVPCSGLGVIGKKRDIKYHASEEGFEELGRLQKEIIRGVWQYVKPGGILLYSTCTVRDQENRRMVKWMTDNFPFEPVPLETFTDGALLDGIRAEREAYERTKQAELSRDCCVQLLPGILGTDGFFFAKLRRRK